MRDEARANVTARMHCRRLTHAYSQSAKHLKATIALPVPWYNFCRVHQTLRVTRDGIRIERSHLVTAGNAPYSEGCMLRIAFVASMLVACVISQPPAPTPPQPNQQRQQQATPA